jgi:hypothetical protein
MPAYRAFFVDQRGYITRPPRLLDCTDDDAALKQAQQLVDGCDVELWDHARIVAWLGRNGVTVTK